MSGGGRGAEEKTDAEHCYYNRTNILFCQAIEWADADKEKRNASPNNGGHAGEDSLHPLVTCDAVDLQRLTRCFPELVKVRPLVFQACQKRRLRVGRSVFEQPVF